MAWLRGSIAAACNSATAAVFTSGSRHLPRYFSRIPDGSDSHRPPSVEVTARAGRIQCNWTGWPTRYRCVRVSIDEAHKDMSPRQLFRIDQW